MVGKMLPPVRITPEEAISLFDFIGCEEMYRAKELFEEFKKKKRIAT